MSISVVIPTCGRPNLEYTVASVLRELHPTEGDQLIVVGPRKPAVISPCYNIRDDFIWIQHENGGYDPNTLLSLNREPGYPSGAHERDLGRAVATGTHLMVIDDDDIFVEGALSAARVAIATEPETVHIFRMLYGCTKQWRSPDAKNLRAGWNRGLTYPEEEWVLWGEPLLKLGNVGSAMVLFPNDPRLKWDCSAPGNVKNQNEDLWVVINYVKEIDRRPIFVPTVIGIIKPTPQQIAEILHIDPPSIRYGVQSIVGWNGEP